MLVATAPPTVSVRSSRFSLPPIHSPPSELGCRLPPAFSLPFQNHTSDLIPSLCRSAGGIGTNGGVVICMHGQQKSNGCSLRLCHQPDLRLQHHPLVSLDSAYDPIARFTTNRRQQPDDHEGAGRHVGRKRCYGLCNLEPMVRQTAYSSSESVAGAAPRRWRGCSLCLLEAEPLREAPEC